MADDSVSVLDRGFALTIAFVLPGLIPIAGLATVNPTVRSWFAGATNGPTFAGVLFVLMGALAVGLIITTLRWALYERASIGWLGCPWVSKAPSHDLSKRATCEGTFRTLTHDHYFHYLAYANTSVAIPIAVTAWKFGSHSPEPSRILFWGAVAAAGIVCGILRAAACDAVNRYDARVTDLLGLLAPPATSSAVVVEAASSADGALPS